MEIVTKPQLDFHNVLIKPKKTSITSRSQVDLERELKFPHSTMSWKGLPIVASNMDTIGTFDVYNELVKHKIITCFHKFYTLEDYKNRMSGVGLDPNFFMISTGIDYKHLDTLSKIVKITRAKFICIDVANGYMTKVIEFCKKVRQLFPNQILVAGNVVCAESTQELITEGKVDIVKVGIGSGAACTTRVKTGIGRPQLSSVIECAESAHKVNGFIISDGGICTPGDAVKALCGNSDFVMCGSFFAGHDENPGEFIIENDQKFKVFYGMSSKKAMIKHYGRMANYRSSEGRVCKIRYKGPLKDTVLDLLGGIRSACSYICSYTIEDMPKNTTFLIVSKQFNTSLTKS